MTTEDFRINMARFLNDLTDGNWEWLSDDEDDGGIVFSLAVWNLDTADED